MVARMHLQQHDPTRLPARVSPASQSSRPMSIAVLVLVPSLLLLEQVLREWSEQTKQRRLKAQ
jgi:predicted helicase